MTRVDAAAGAPATIPSPPAPPKRGVVELFAGAAGLAQGFLRSGPYELIALTDKEECAKQTFQANFPDVPYLASPIEDLEPRQFKELADGRRIAGVLGGPPCQGFSLAGPMDPKDKRNKYVSDYVKFVEKLSPDFLLMENVPQLFYHSQFEDLLTALRSDYDVVYGVLNSAQYGAPQTRHRAIVLAFHRRLGIRPTLPKATHGFGSRPLFNYRLRKLQRPTTQEKREDILGPDPVLKAALRLEKVAEVERAQPIVTVADALGDLEPLESGAKGTGYDGKARTAYQRQLRAGAPEVTEHEARLHTADMLKLIRQVPEGGDLSDVERSLWPKSHYSQAYGRLHRAGLARTVTTFFCNPGSGRFTHYRDLRTITVREAARLQGFSDSFVFRGTQSQKMALIGNAVPVPLARALADHIHTLLTPGA
jgi:DNA (cytosine-5)-methyltransferase 1